MKPSAPSASRLLSLDPCHRGIGYVVLEPPARLVDWGVHRIPPSANAGVACLARMLIVHYRPTELVVESLDTKPRRQRARKLIGRAVAVATKAGVAVHTQTGTQVQEVFGRWEARTKEERMSWLVARFPPLAIYRPKFRKPWMSEDPSTSIFDALALLLTRLETEEQTAEATPPSVQT